MAAWTADLTSVASQPRVLRSWRNSVLEAGEEQHIYTVQAAPLVKYSASAPGRPLAEFLNDLEDDGETVDLFHFASSGTAILEGKRLEVTSRVAVVDEAGQVVEREVSDLAAFLAEVRSVTREEAGSLLTPGPPVAIDGPLVDCRVPPSRVNVRFSISSDIWLPQVSGYLEEEFSLDRWYDNRLLAERHTPRLNEFLHRVRTASEECGAAFEIDEEWTTPAIRSFVGLDGIDLRGTTPG